MVKDLFKNFVITILAGSLSGVITGLLLACTESAWFHGKILFSSIKGEIDLLLFKLAWEEFCSNLFDYFLSGLWWGGLGGLMTLIINRFSSQKKGFFGLTILWALILGALGFLGGFFIAANPGLLEGITFLAIGLGFGAFFGFFLAFFINIFQKNNFIKKSEKNKNGSPFNHPAPQ